MNLIPILQKHFKEGDRLYSMVHGQVNLIRVDDSSEKITYPIVIELDNGSKERLTLDGKCFDDRGECILFPDTDKDWSKLMGIKEGDAVVYSKDGIWQLGRAAKKPYSGKMGVKQPDGNIYLPEEMILPELFDFNNLENMKL